MTDGPAIREQSSAMSEFLSYNQDMEATVRTYDSLKEMKADEYRYWQSRPAHERISAVSEMTRAAYAMKESVPNVRRLQRTLVCLQRPQR